MAETPNANTTDDGAAPARLDWFRHDILPDGRQIRAIRRSDGFGSLIILDAGASELLHMLLTEFAKADGIAFGGARQIALRAFSRPPATIAPTR